MAMQLTPPPTPDIPTVRVTARDAKTGKSKSTTVYETTPEEVISAFEGMAAAHDEQTKPAPQRGKPPCST